MIAGLGVTSYLRFIQKARIAKAVVEIASIANTIDADRLYEQGPPPDSLAGLGLDTPIDPWGNPYRYLRIEGVFAANPPQGISLPAVAAKPPKEPKPPKEGGEPPGGGGPPIPTKPRKDRFLKPLSTDYDLYSSGLDGLSTATLEAKHSHDDVIRALEGDYIGLAELF
jgi:general secretion pathway protein G